MKATGIVRRIDDLGRVVIPKEIRRTMHIREGDPLEIFTDKEGGVIFKKYSPLGELSNFAGDCCTSLYTVSGMFCCVCDMDNVIAYSGQGKRDILERSVSRECEQLILSRKNYFAQGSDAGVKIINDTNSPVIIAASPIISEGDVMGLVAFLETPDRKSSVTEEKLLSSYAMFLGKQMEN